MKNKGEVRYQIALERILWHDLRGSGRSFLSYKMGEITLYALTGKLSERATWKPTPEDIYQIDQGTPKGAQFIIEEAEKEFEEMYGGEDREWG